MKFNLISKIFIPLALFCLGFLVAGFLPENLFANKNILGLLTGGTFVGIYLFTNQFLSKSMNIRNTHLEILRLQFDPSLGSFISNTGLNELNASLVSFTTLCPCASNPKRLCPCESAFHLYDPVSDEKGVTFKNGFTNNMVTINPTSVVENGITLHKYIVNTDLFKEDGEHHLIITKDSQSLVLKSFD